MSADEKNGSRLRLRLRRPHGRRHNRGVLLLKEDVADRHGGLPRRERRELKVVSRVSGKSARKWLPRVRFELATLRLTAEADSLRALSGVAYQGNREPFSPL